MTRIRWRKDPMSNDIIAGPFIAGKTTYLMFISIPKFCITIQSGAIDKTYPFVYSNLREAKKGAKEIIKKIGARFYDEVRKKT
jgi:hypothetical protein